MIGVIHAMAVVGEIRLCGGQVFLGAFREPFAFGEFFHLGGDGIDRPGVVF